MIQCQRPYCGGQLIQEGNKFVCTLCAHEYEMVGSRLIQIVPHYHVGPIINQHGPRAYYN